MNLFHIHCILSSLLIILSSCYAAVVQLTGANIDKILSDADVVFVNFYADWCRFSQMLTPVFEEASQKFEGQTNVVFASVDCDRQPDIASKYHISKYPTLKLFRNGEQSKREYRGQRSKEALIEFMEKQSEASYNEFTSKADLDARINNKKRNIIGYFQTKDSLQFKNLAKISSNLREECPFWFGIGDNFKDALMGGDNVAFKEPNGEEILFSGDMNDPEYLKQWVSDKCIPLVREITFENAEELTEEGLPFLILFRHPTDEAIIKTYNDEVARQLSDQKTAVNFLIADGVKFAHPLHHLGKSEADLPVLAIDSFRHMYVFPDVKELTVPGKLRQFILDLHAGKLHREFHHGPDTATSPEPEPPSVKIGENGQPVLVERPPTEPAPKDGKTTPPESTFKKLRPQSNRYTLLTRDEL